MKAKPDKAWLFKDGSRYYWRVRLYLTGKRPTGFDEGEDNEWTYTIERKNVRWTEIYSATIVGQYDEVPDLEDILLDFNLYIQSFMLEINRYHEESEVK